MVIRVKVGYLIGVVLLLALAGGAWWYFSRLTPEAQVLRVVHELRDCATKGEGESGAGSLFKGQAGGKLFANEPELILPHGFFNGRSTPEEISANLIRFRSMFDQVRIGVKDAIVTMISPDEARVEFGGTLHGKLKTGARVDDVRELICTVKRIDDHWKITSLRVRDVLER